MADHTEALKGYRRARDPDLIKLGELVKSARGAERSVRRFAEETDVNPSTISRIENSKMNGVSNELLVRIAEKADPLSGVTLKDLLYANGLEQYKGFSVILQRREFEKLSADVIRDELFKGGHTFANAVGLEIPAYHGYEPDMLIKTEALNGAWLFSNMWVNPELYEIDRMEGTAIPAARMVERVFQFMSIFYCGPGEIGKVSLVTNSKPVFDKAMESIQRRLNGLEINNLMSLILIDEEERYVIEEWYLPTKLDAPEFFTGDPPEDLDIVDIFNNPIEGQVTYEEWLSMIGDLESEPNNGGKKP